MKPVQRIRMQLGLCLLMALVLGVIIISAFSKPKLYQGKTVRQWVSLLEMHVDYQKQRNEASWALVQIGADALPELERILAWRRSAIETIRNYAVHFRIAKPRAIHPLELQSRACEAAYHLAERANVDISGLVPHLQYHFTNGTYADSNSGRALARAGPTGIRILTKLLLTGTRPVRDNAGSALTHVRKQPEVIAALIQSATSDPDRTLRANAVGYLRGCDGPADQLLPLGLKFLGSEDGYDRCRGAMLLQNYLSMREVRTAFEAAISDPDERVRSVVQRVLPETSPR
jgi:HEAT repeat protein